MKFAITMDVFEELCLFLVVRSRTERGKERLMEVLL